MTDISEIDIHPQHTKHMLCKIIQNSNNECLKIQEYGDIFCVRTAITLFNITLETDKQIPCNISDIIHNKLQMKNAYRKNCTPSLQIKHGAFKVVFD